MKIPPADAARFVRAPDPGLRAILIYGGDGGQVRERAGQITAAIAGDAADPFRVATIGAAELSDDPARLADETAALSLTGGRRVVRLTGAQDAAAAALAELLAADAATVEALTVVEAGELAPRSRLRKLFENADNAAALACYPDDRRALEGVIRETVAAAGLEITDDATIYLCDNLGNDRMVSRSELDKLVVYAMGSGTIALEDAALCVGDSSAMTLEDIAFATASGDQALLSQGLRRAFDEGLDPIAVVRAVLRHFQRLHLAAGRAGGGATIDQAMKALRPPVFFRRADAFRAQLRRWRAPALMAALGALTDAEADCKTTGLPAETMCGRALMRLAASGQRRA